MYHLIIPIISVISSLSCLPYTDVESSDVLRPYPKIIAHRGFWNTDGSAENSLTAIKEAVRIGADGVEFDLRVTADDSIVVVHDAIVEGMTVAKSSFMDLRSISLPNGERIPTLYEYLLTASQYPQLELFVELKTSQSVSKVLSIISSFKLRNKITFISFWGSICNEIITNYEGANVELLLKSNQKVVQPVDFSPGYTGMAYQMSVLKRDPFLIIQGKDSGLSITVWKINSIKDFLWAKEIEADYVISDYPDILIKQVSGHYAILN